MALPQLPPELWIQIFSFTAPEFDTYASSAAPYPPALCVLPLVSRTFCALSRPILYERITAYDPFRLLEVAGVLADHEELAKANHEVCLVQGRPREDWVGYSGAWRLALDYYFRAAPNVKCVGVVARERVKLLFSLDWLWEGKDTLEKIVLVNVVLEDTQEPDAALRLDQVRELCMLAYKPNAPPREECDVNLARHLPNLTSFLFCPTANTMKGWPSFISQIFFAPENESLMDHLVEFDIMEKVFLIIMAMRSPTPSNLSTLRILDVAGHGDELDAIIDMACDYLKASETTQPRRLILNSADREWSSIETSFVAQQAARRGLRIDYEAPLMDEEAEAAYRVFYEAVREPQHRAFERELEAMDWGDPADGDQHADGTGEDAGDRLV
ncbi:hypothetical protein JCM8097_007865 [Rhodosporidiobolus ruineniae]